MYIDLYLKSVRKFPIFLIIRKLDEKFFLVCGVLGLIAIRSIQYWGI